MFRKLKFLFFVFLSFYLGDATSAISQVDKPKVQELVTDFEDLFIASQANKQGRNHFYKRNTEGSNKLCLNTPDYSTLSATDRKTCMLNALDMYQRAPAMDALVDMYLIVKELETSGGYNIRISSLSYISHALNMANTYFKSHENYHLDEFSFNEFKNWQGQASVDVGKDFNYELRAASGIARLLAVTASNDVPRSVYLQSYSVAKQMYHHVWKKWTGGSSHINIKNVDALGTDIFARAGIVALALAAWSDSEQHGIKNNLALPKQEFIQFLERRLPNMLRQPTNVDYYLIFVRMNATANYCKRDGWCDGKLNTDRIIEHPGSLYDIGHARDIILLSTLLEHGFSQFENYSYIGISNDISTRRLYNTLINDVWRGGVSFRDWPKVRSVNHINEFNDYTYKCHPDMPTVCNKEYINEDFSAWEQAEQKGSHQGGWAKLSKYDGSLRQAYFDMNNAGGVFCFSNDELIRYGNASSFGASTSADIERCNKNTVFTQAQVISSLLHAYFNQVD